MVSVPVSVSDARAPVLPFGLLRMIPLPAVELNRFVLLTPAPHYLDIMLHDDTTVDYVKLIVRFE